VQKSAGKVLALIFWDQDGILLIDCLPKGHTINAENYSSLLVQLKGILTEKRGGKFTKGVLFLHDNGPAHRTRHTNGRSLGTATRQFFETSIGFDKSTVASSS